MLDCTNTEIWLLVDLVGGVMTPPALCSDPGADYRPVFRSHAPSSPLWRRRVESFMETKLTKDIFSG